MARPIHVLECAFGSNPDDALTSQVWTDIAAYLDTQAGVKVTRGRTDEFSAVSPGTMALTLKNVDGRFTMGDASSPYFPNVVPGKRIRYGLMWPGGGKNYAETLAIANPETGPGWFVQGTGTPTTILTTPSPAPPNSTVALQITWGSTPANQFVFQTLRGLVIGKTYTASADLRVPTAAGAQHCQLSVFGVATGTATSAFDTWQRRTVTFTATANTHQLRVIPVATPTAGTVCRVSAVQVEDGPSFTTFTATPGTFAWRFTGDVNEWPLSWQGGPGLYAETQLTASDRLAKLGDLGEFRSLLEESALSMGPFAFYPLGESALATSVSDVSPNAQPAMTVVQVGSGGTISLGSDTYDFPTSPATPSQPPFYMPDGGGQSSTGASFLAPSTGNGKFLRASLNAPTTGTLGASLVVFDSSGSGTPAAGTVASMQAADGSYFSIERDGSLQQVAVFFDSTTGVRTALTAPDFFTFDMGQHAAVLWDTGGGTWQIDQYANGVLLTSTTFATARTMPKWTTVSIGGRTKDPLSVLVAYAQFYDYPVSSSDIAVQSFAAQGGTTDTPPEGTTDRLTALKNFAGLDAMFIRGTGIPKTAGPQEIVGSPLDAFAKVVDTEAGLFLIQADGFPTFHLASYRYNVASSLSLAADRLDPNALTFRGDNFGVYDDVTATGATGLVGRSVNAASVAAYGRRKGSVETLGVDVASLLSSAARLAYGFGTARNRITGVRFSPLNDASLIAAALGLDVGEKITISALPAQAPASSVDLFVEGYSETVSEDDWSMTLTTSPAEPWNVWQLGVAGHSELGSTTILAY